MKKTKLIFAILACYGLCFAQAQANGGAEGSDPVVNHQASNDHYVSVNGSENTSSSNYDNTGAAGEKSIAIGENAGVTTKKSISIGNQKITQQDNVIVIGYNTENGADSLGNVGVGSVVIGNDNKSNASQDGLASNLVFGNANTLQKTNINVFGSQNDINGANVAPSGPTFVFGDENKVVPMGHGMLMGNGNEIWNNTYTGNDDAFVWGVDSNQGSLATSDFLINGSFNKIKVPFASGAQGTISGLMVLGRSNTLVGAGEHFVVGNYNKVNGGAQVLGVGNIVGLSTSNVSQSIVLGEGNRIYDANNASKNINKATVLGFLNEVWGDNTVSVGNINYAHGAESVAFGHDQYLTGKQSIAVGIGNNTTKGGQPFLANGDYSTAIGLSNVSAGIASSAVGNQNQSKGVQSSALGFKNTTSGDRAAALGSQNVASGDLSTSVGVLNNYAKNSGEQSSAVGFWNESIGESSSAIGHRNIVAGKNSTGVGYNNNVNSVLSSVFGGENTVSGTGISVVGYGNNAVGQDAVIVGHGSSIASGASNPTIGAVVLGSDASSNISNSVVLGSHAIASRDSGEWGLYAGDSLKSKAKELESNLQKDVDAINAVVTQLNELVGDQDPKNLPEAQKKTFDTLFGKYKTLKSNLDDAKQAASNSMIAWGVPTWRASLAAVSVGDPEKGLTRQITGVAAGTNDTDAVNVAQLKAAIDSVKVTAGTNIEVEPNSASTSGDPSGGTTAPTTGGGVKVSLAEVVTFEGKTSENEKQTVQISKDGIELSGKTNIEMGGNKITGLADGKENSDAVNLGQLKDLVSKAGGSLTINGDEGVYQATGELGIKGGADVQHLTENNIGVVVDEKEKTAKVKLSKNLDGMNSIKFGPKPEGQPDNRVSISSKGLDNGGHQIKNVAAGVADTDAVNVGQLKGAVNKSEQHYRALDAKIDHTESRMRKFSNANAASALATANIPQVYAPGKNAVGVGLGNMNGQSAIAVGISTINDKGDWIFKGTATVNSEGQGFGGGVSYVW